MHFRKFFQWVMLAVLARSVTAARTMTQKAHQEIAEILEEGQVESLHNSSSMQTQDLAKNPSDILRSAGFDDSAKFFAAMKKLPGGIQIKYPNKEGGLAAFNLHLSKVYSGLEGVTGVGTGIVNVNIWPANAMFLALEYKFGEAKVDGKDMFWMLLEKYSVNELKPSHIAAGSLNLPNREAVKERFPGKYVNSHSVDLDHLMEDVSIMKMYFYHKWGDLVTDWREQMSHHQNRLQRFVFDICLKDLQHDGEATFVLLSPLENSLETSDEVAEVPRM